MADIKKVIEGLEYCCSETVKCFSGCPYDQKCEKLRRDALELLRERQWRPFEMREPDAEEKEIHPDWVYVMVNTPEEDEEILVTDGKHVWFDTFMSNGDQCYLDSGDDFDGCMWMPLPEAPKEGDSE